MNTIYQKIISRYKNPLKRRFGGFTLIELLVVVLIIGILAAVALPQYRLAVEKSRAMQAVIAVRAISDSFERYYMANGNYGPNISGDSLVDFSVLDISMPDVDGFYYFRHQNIYVAAKRKNSDTIYTISKTLKNGTQNAEWQKRGLTCHTEITSNGNDLPARICKSFCGVSELKQVWGSGQLGCEFK